MQLWVFNLLVHVAGCAGYLCRCLVDGVAHVGIFLFSILLIYMAVVFS
jgi:hypothetical protein